MICARVRSGTREIEWHDSREKALTAEARAIVRELRRLNDVGVRRPHHRLVEAPAKTLHTMDFKVDPQGWMDRVAETRGPLVIARHGVPQVVTVPYFDGSQANDGPLEHISTPCRFRNGRGLRCVDNLCRNGGRAASLATKRA